MNFLGLLGHLGSLLPGYIEGRRAAIQDNWQDMTNYNTVLNGQLQNLLNAVTFPDMLSSIQDSAAQSHLNTMQSGLNFYGNAMTAPTALQQMLLNAQLGLQYLPQMYAQNYGVGTVVPTGQQQTQTQPQTQTQTPTYTHSQILFGHR